MQLINNESKTACEIAELEEDYENAIGQAVLEFTSESNVKVDLVCNHGQTIFHAGFSPNAHLMHIWNHNSRLKSRESALKLTQSKDLHGNLVVVLKWMVSN